MHDVNTEPGELFTHQRPSVVVDEGQTANTFHPEVITEVGLEKTLDLKLRCSNILEDQYVASYLPRIFPWTLNYDCGGPDYPDLFEKDPENSDFTDKDREHLKKTQFN